MEQAMDAFVKQVQSSNIIEFKPLEQIFAEHGYRAEAGGEKDHILVLRLDEIGDVILTSAFLRELRRNYPAAWITLVVRDAIYPLAELCPYVDEVLPFPSWKNDIPLMDRIPRFVEFCRVSLWERHYSKCYCPRWDADIQFAFLLAYLSGAKQRIGYSVSVYPQREKLDFGWDNVLTDAIVNPPYVVHEVERNLYLLKALGAVVQDDSIEVWLNDEDEMRARRLCADARDVLKSHRLVAVTIGSRELSKAYPPELLAKALKLLLPKHCCFALLGGPEDVAAGEKIRAELPEGVAWNLAGKASLRESCAVISHAALLIGNDTGMTHAAAALHVPIVELNCHARDVPVFAWSFYARFFPWQVPSIVLRPPHAAAGCEHPMDAFSQVRGCRSMEPHCICGIPPEWVANAVERIIG